MKIGRINNSIVTEHGDINHPKMNNRQAWNTKLSFGSGFLSGVAASLLAAWIWSLLAGR